MKTDKRRGRPFGSITLIIRATCENKNGAAMAEIREAIDRDSQHAAAMVNHCVQRGFIFKAGVRAHLRYFTDPAHRDAFAQVAQKLHDDERKAAHEAKLLRLREYYGRKADAQRAEIERIRLDEKAKKAAAELKKKAAAKVELVLPSKKRAGANHSMHVIWPAHVKVRQIPCQQDTRFTFTPAPGWKGEITRDWMNRRLQSVSGLGA